MQITSWLKRAAFAVAAVMCAFSAEAADISGAVAWPYGNAISDPNFEDGATKTLDGNKQCNFPTEEQPTGWYGKGGWATKNGTYINTAPVNGNYLGRIENDAAISNRFIAAFPGDYEFRFKYARAYGWWSGQELGAAVDETELSPHWSATSDAWQSKVFTNRLEAGSHVFSIIGKGSATKRSVFDEVSIKLLTPAADGLLVAAEPRNYSTGSAPYYGMKTEVASGDEFTFTAPGGEVTLENGLKTKIVGWTIYRYNPQEQSFVIESRSTEQTKLSCTYRHGDQAGAVVWQWAAPYAEPTGVTRYWTGLGEDNLASTAANWVDGNGATGAPVAGDAIVLNGAGAADDPANKPMTYDAAAPWCLASWTQNGYTNVVTFGTVFDLSGFTRLHIAGDVALASGKWTHLANKGNFKVYRLDVSVGGNLTTGPDAAIDVSVKGYTNALGAGAGLIYLGGDDKLSDNEGGCYGGRPGHSGGRGLAPYGLYYAPADDLGACGTLGDSTGGGSVMLTVAGSLVHNGAIMSDGQKSGWGYYNGGGGGIHVIAHDISGTGTMSACSQNQQNTGAGGRIAINLTGEGCDFSDYDVVKLVRANSYRNAADAGAAGSIYCETAADVPRHGWFIAKGCGTVPGEVIRYCTPFTIQLGPTTWFDHITVTNKTMLYVPAGFTLDLSRTTKWDGAPQSDTACGLYCAEGALAVDPEEQHFFMNVLLYNGQTLDTQKLVLDGAARLVVDKKPATLTGDLELADKAQIFITDLTVGGDVLFGAGSTGSCQGPFVKPTSTLKLTVGGDMTVEAGAKLTADGKGYQNSYGNEPSTGGYGGSHAGWGQTRTSGTRNATRPYGSIYDPTTYGSGGNFKAGGGVLLLDVAGALTVDGTIASRGDSNNQDTGAGGSVNVKAGSLAGAATGLVSADCGPCTGDNSCGAGGRIAVTLRTAGATFADYLGAFSAKGYNRGKSYVPTGAGTIYLREAGEAVDAGTLIVDNGASDYTKTALTTTLGDLVTDNAFGTVVITNCANLELAPNASISVSGDWLKSADFTAQPGSTVNLTGTGDALVAGRTTFANLGSTAAGKTVRFAEGAEVKVTGAVSFSGAAGNRIVLRSADEEGTWTLDTAGASATLENVDLGGCQSTAEITVINGTDLGGNSGNVRFISVTPGETLTWTGEAGAGWGLDGSWDKGRAPVSTDVIVIPAGCAAYPSLAVGTAVAQLTVEADASLDIANQTLTVAGDVVMNGNLVGTTGVLEIGGDASFAGTVGSGYTTVRLNGTAAQAFAVSGATFYGLDVKSPAVSFTGDLTCFAFTAGDGTMAEELVFAAGMTFKPNQFTVSGDASAANVTLRSSEPGTAWRLTAMVPNVTGAVVSDADASKGVAVVPTASVDAGGNVNWFFVDTRVHWDGTQPVTAEDDVVIDGGVSVTVTAATEVKSLTLDPGATLKVSAPLDVKGPFTACANTTTTWDVPGTIGGDLVLLDGAVLTHTGNGTTQKYAIDLAIGGGGYIDAGAKVNCEAKGSSGVDTMGCSKQTGVGQDGGASHGGRGYQNCGASIACYGSILCPTNMGSYGTWGSKGGGAVKMIFAGDVTLDGVISVEGQSGYSYYTGSGGSIWLGCATLSGVGTLTANGATATGQSQWGAGGRIAVYQTVATSLDLFRSSVTAYGGRLENGNTKSSAGTVYYENANDQPGWGRVVLSNRPGQTSRDDSLDRTDFPSTRYVAEGETYNVTVEVSNYATMNVMDDCRIESLSLDGTARILLNGHTLRVNMERPKSWPKGGALPANVIPGGTAEAPGKIVWKSGLVFLLR